MKKLREESNKADKLMSRAPFTGSFGTSDSAHLSSESSGMTGDGSNSLLPGGDEFESKNKQK